MSKAKETLAQYRAYLRWFGKIEKLMGAGKSRYHYPLTIEKYKRAMKRQGKS